MKKNVRMPDIASLEKRLGITFQDKNVLLTAMVHRSYLNEHPRFRIEHNERLEFLGDAVLELIVTEYLYTHFPNPEGELTNWRASLVNAHMLGSIAQEICLNEYILLSKGEAKDTNSKARLYILANAFEALIGAIYIDQGWDVSRAFVLDHVVSKLPYILEHGLYMDPKSKFQEAAQEKEGVTPTYKVLKEDGPDHAKHFTVGVFLGDEMVAEGGGTSKQEAQVEAAKRALKAKGWEKYKTKH